jgi:hypothetical protein
VKISPGSFTHPCSKKNSICFSPSPSISKARREANSFRCSIFWNGQANSPLHRCFQGEVWGADMYQTLRRSHVALNSHIDFAGQEAGNMRLFEATGVGAFLLTDFKDNLHTLFAPDREVGVWRSVDDCVAAIGRAVSDGDNRAAIARAGQARTMAQHTYSHRIQEILGFVGVIGRLA